MAAVVDADEPGAARAAIGGGEGALGGGAGFAIGRGIDHRQRRAQARQIAGEVDGAEIVHRARDHIGVAAAVGCGRRGEGGDDRGEELAPLAAADHRLQPLRELRRGRPAVEGGRLRRHVDHHQPADQMRMLRGQHHPDRAAHRMADHRRPLQASAFDIAGKLGDQRPHHRPVGIAAGGLAGEAGDLQQMIAMARRRGDRAAPDVAAGGEAGDQDHVAARCPRTRTEKRVGSNARTGRRGCATAAKGALAARAKAADWIRKARRFMPA